MTPSSGGGGGKFGIGGVGSLFGVSKDKDDDSHHKKEERKREERERKEREKKQKALEKELKKDKKRREAEGDSCDDDAGLTSSSSWRLGSGKKKSNAPLTKEDPKPEIGPTVSDTVAPAPVLSLNPLPTSGDGDKVGAQAEDSDSCSVDIASPVFAHITDSEAADDDLGLSSTDRGPGFGYRYGGNYAKVQREKGNERQEKIKKTEAEAPPPAQPVRQTDRGEWIILDMGNDHGQCL
jgi:hypothetical protein